MLGLDALVSKQFRDSDLVVLALTLSEDWECDEERARLGLSYDFIPRAVALWKTYGVDCAPLTVIIDRKGFVRCRATKPIAEERAVDGTYNRVELVRRLIAEPGE